jgi:radical SAM/Cys-rich protein
VRRHELLLRSSAERGALGADSTPGGAAAGYTPLGAHDASGVGRNRVAFSVSQSDASPGADAFERTLEEHGLAPLTRTVPTILQLNLTLRCNLACHHCHVESGPKRSESLSREGCERVLSLIEASPSIDTLDLTGGAPELHPDFRFVVAGARALGRDVIDRCNLTVLHEPGQQDTAEFLAEQRVRIIASLPCYGAENVERQRGRGVFDRSIDALRRLNALGYGQRDGRSLRLDLVYNPVGAFLPPDQAELETTYREELRDRFGIEFDGLLTITNMPIKRFAHDLEREGQLEAYQSLLAASFNPTTVAGLMCRNLVNVDHEGRLHDCDFNFALGIDPPTGALTIDDVDDLAELAEEPIATASHCFGCTAGAGSSCGGALS